MCDLVHSLSFSFLNKDARNSLEKIETNTGESRVQFTANTKATTRREELASPPHRALTAAVDRQLIESSTREGEEGEEGPTRLHRRCEEADTTTA